MTCDLTFDCTGVQGDRYAAGPTLLFRLRIGATGGRVHALALRCQLRIEPAKRTYDDAEAERLGDLFGERNRWGTSMHPVQFAQVPMLVPGFTGGTDAELAVPCTYDLDIAATRYLAALDGGDIPLVVLFSGTVFTGETGFTVEPVPWHKETTVRVPVRVWREMMEQHFPGCGWLRLPRDTMDELLAYRSRLALPSWEATVRSLLAGAGTGADTGADTRPALADGGVR